MTSSQKDVYSQLDAYAYGQRLSKQREQKGLSISDVSGQLKLSAVQIAALESGDYQSLPELVYVRGFLRQYSAFLGIEDSEAKEFIEHLAPKPSDSQYNFTINADMPAYQEPQIFSASWLKWALAGAITASVLGGIYIWQTKSNTAYTKQESEANAGFQVTSSDNIPSSNVTVMAMASEQAASQIASSSLQTASSDIQASDVPLQIAADELLVSVRYRSKLFIQDKDGKELINKIVPGGSEYRYRGGAPYQVYIGYSLGSRANFGGQDFPVEKHKTGKTTSSFKAGK